MYIVYTRPGNARPRRRKDDSEVFICADKGAFNLIFARNGIEVLLLMCDVVSGEYIASLSNSESICECLIVFKINNELLNCGFATKSYFILTIGRVVKRSIFLTRYI